MPSLANLRIVLAFAAAFVAGVLVTQEPRVAPHHGTDPAGAIEGGGRISSIFVDFAVEHHPYERPAPGTGGAVEEVDGRPVVITKWGRILALEDGRLRQTGIAPPENGFAALDAYLASPEAKAAGHEIKMVWFRFMDLRALRFGGRDWLATSYTEWRPEERCYATAIARLPLPGDRDSLVALTAAPEDWEVVYRTEPCLPLKDDGYAMEPQMAGGRMALLGGARVALSSGDYAWDGVYHDVVLAQSGDNHYGKVMEVDLGTGAARELARGLSNPQGIATDAAGGIWVIDHGRRGGDELNLVEEGANFGWPEVTLGTRYNWEPWPGSGAYGHHDGYDRPMFAWLPSVAVSALDRIEGLHPAWDGDLVAGSLSGQALYRVRVREGRVLFAERIPVGGRVRSLRQLSDGRLALWMDFHGLVLLAPVERGATAAAIARTIGTMDLAEADRGALETTLETCLQCHQLLPGSEGTAMSLVGILGRRVASGAGGDYSEALRARGGETWDRVSLAAFVDAPGDYAPGTDMPDPGVDPGPTLDALVEFLARYPAGQPASGG